MSPKISKPSKKVSGRKVKSTNRVLPHTVWEYKPKLQNEAAVLYSILSIYDIPYYKEIVDDVRGLITQLVRNHGFSDGSQRYKIIKDYTVSLIEGRNPENPGWLATSKVYRVPSALGKNFTQLVADYLKLKDTSMRFKYYQVINTVLNIVRMVEGLVDPDLQSVTDKAKPIDQDILDEFTDYINESLDNIKPIDNNINLFNIRFNLKKNGPNGKPKIESSIQEAHELLNSKLARPFRIVCQELNCEYLYEYLTLVTKEISNGPEDSNLQSESIPKTKLRVLASIPDRGFKTRLVAIVDFWSQLILEPFRSYIQFVIEKKFRKTDFRKDQDLGVAQMVTFQKRCLNKEVIERNGITITLDVKHLKCYDISSWTDKFHRDLQKIVVKKLFSARFSEAWAQLVVHCDWYYPKLDCIVKYGQGQGMGTNGSFDIATLTDHLFINYVIDKKTCLKGVFPSNECYGKVGDDLWIYDPDNQIPIFYEKISLPINISKSKFSSVDSSYMEFCSRTFFDSEDVSRISPNIISKSKDYRYIPILLGLCSSRGIQLDATLFETLNNTVKGSELTYLHKLQDWIVGMLLIGQYEQSSYWKSLTYDYLVAGNWVVGDLVKDLYQDPKLLTRLMIAHSIVTITENLEAVQSKVFEILDASEVYSDGVTHLIEDDTNLFDITNLKYCSITNATGKQILSPKEIIILGRYVDQKRLISIDLKKVNEEVRKAQDPKDIVKFSKDLAMVAQKSCYDEGNINYSIDRVYGTQYKIVKTIERMNEDYTVLSGVESHQLRPLSRCLPMDEVVRKWKEYIPDIQVDNSYNDRNIHLPGYS